MNVYKVYFEDPCDKRFIADEFRACDDEAAAQVAERIAGGTAAELWCGNRLVKRWSWASSSADA